MEETKVVKVGAEGQNTAKVTSTVFATLDLVQKNASKLLRRAGSHLTPSNCVDLGSIGVHFYVEKGTDENKPAFKVVCQLAISDIPEGLADFGHKQLREQLMRHYGRKIPAIRQDVV